MAGGEDFAIVVARLAIGWRSDRPTLRHLLEELASAGIRDGRPEGGVERLRIVQGIAGRARLGEQLVIDPEVGDDAHDILAKRHLRGAEQLRELLDGQFLGTSLRNGVGVRAERTAVAANQLGHGASGDRGEGKSLHA